MTATRINVHSAIASIAHANRQIQDQEATLDKIDSTINAMQGIWEAEDQKVYAERFRDRKRKINDFNRAVGEYLSSMRKYIDDCVAADDRTCMDLMNISW